MKRRARRRRLGFPKSARQLVMSEVASVAELGLPEDEAKAELEKRVIARFDPASILISILVTWAIKQLIAWIHGKIKNKELGDEDEA
jgi:hypothetical protein